MSCSNTIQVCPYMDSRLNFTCRKGISIQYPISMDNGDTPPTAFDLVGATVDLAVIDDDGSTAIQLSTSDGTIVKTATTSATVLTLTVSSSTVDTWDEGAYRYLMKATYGSGYVRELWQARWNILEGA